MRLVTEVDLERLTIRRFVGPDADRLARRTVDWLGCRGIAETGDNPAWSWASLVLAVPGDIGCPSGDAGEADRPLAVGAPLDGGECGLPSACIWMGDKCRSIGGENAELTVVADAAECDPDLADGGPEIASTGVAIQGWRVSESGVLMYRVVVIVTGSYGCFARPGSGGERYIGEEDAAADCDGDGVVGTLSFVPACAIALGEVEDGVPVRIGVLPGGEPVGGVGGGTVGGDASLASAVVAEVELGVLPNAAPVAVTGVCVLEWIGVRALDLGVPAAEAMAEGGGTKTCPESEIRSFVRGVDTARVLRTGPVALLERVAVPVVDERVEARTVGGVSVSDDD